MITKDNKEEYHVTIPPECQFLPYFELTPNYGNTLLNPSSNVGLPNNGYYFPINDINTTGILNNNNMLAGNLDFNKRLNLDYNSITNRMLSKVDVDSPPPSQLPLKSHWRTFIQLAEQEKSSWDSSCIKQEKLLTNLEEVLSWHHSMGYPGLWVSLDKPIKALLSRYSDSPMEGICLFKEGITPSWEAKENKFGGHYECRVIMNDKMKSDVMNNLCFLLVLLITGSEASVDPSNNLNGIRILKKTQAKRSVTIKIEIWQKHQDKTILDRIDHEIENLWDDESMKSQHLISLSSEMTYKSRGNSGGYSQRERYRNKNSFNNNSDK